jgi:hypothetical protein
MSTSPMTHPERFRALMNFQPVDRLPRVEWAAWWDQTVARWNREGLPVSDRYEMYKHFGLDMYYQMWFPTHGPGCPGPKSHGAGIIETADDYRAIRQYLYPDCAEAIEAFRPWAEEQNQGDAVVYFTLEGFFWFPRTLFGIEKHLYAFFDEPELMHEINQDLANWHLRVLKRLAPICKPEFMTFAEDMSYNHGPMLSKALFDEFLAPYYRQVIPVLKEMGTRAIVDSDGDITTMVPWMESAGIEGVLPLERQAGVDAAKLREQFPRFLMIGHYDKMVMTRGEEAMRAEFERLLPVMRQGGYLPGVDHQTPPGVSLAEYRIYLRLLEEYAVKGASGQ